VDSVFADYLAPGAPGASVLVVDGGQLVLRKAYGRSAIAEHRSATVTTNYRLGSLSQQFTAVATLMLVQDGRLRLTDSLGGIFPALPHSFRPITIRQLLDHTSGLPDYETLIPLDTRVPLKDDDVWRLLQGHDSLMFPPGSAYHVSNSGYALLAVIIERLSGQRFADLLRERIFIPLGMTGTVAFEEGFSHVPEPAEGYSRGTEGGWKVADRSLTSGVLGDGGIYSSVSDLERWYHALDSHTLLKSDLQAEMFRPSSFPDGPAGEYGFGWSLRPFQGQRSYGQGGEMVGFRNGVRRLPDRGLTVVVLTNRDEGDAMELVDRVCNRVLQGGAAPSPAAGARP
jgi:CubicO group peptidase (beta-lactamase class C family)